MNQAQKLINAAFENLIRISVQGDDVEKMAAAKALLAQAHKEAGTPDKEEQQEVERDGK